MGSLSNNGKEQNEDSPPEEINHISRAALLNRAIERTSSLVYRAIVSFNGTAISARRISRSCFATRS